MTRAELRLSSRHLTSPLLQPSQYFVSHYLGAVRSGAALPSTVLHAEFRGGLRALIAAGVATPLASSVSSAVVGFTYITPLQSYQQRHPRVTYPQHSWCILVGCIFCLLRDPHRTSCLSLPWCSRGRCSDGRLHERCRSQWHPARTWCSPQPCNGGRACGPDSTACCSLKIERVRTNKQSISTNVPSTLTLHPVSLQVGRMISSQYWLNIFL